MASSVSNAVSSSDNDDYDITTEASKDIASLKVKFKRAKDGNGVSKRDGNGVSKRKSSTDSNPSSPKTPKVKSKLGDGDELPPPFFFTSLAGGPPGGKLESLLKQAMKEPPIKKQKVRLIDSTFGKVKYFMFVVTFLGDTLGSRSNSRMQFVLEIVQFVMPN